uniref:malate dehydrogenase n=1 Tax=Neobodo designis TaxID=312471 RepID=A0A7S1LZ87_NEODS
MVNVAVIGAGGGIGQPLSLLLKLRLPHGSTLSLFDVMGAPGVAADLSHVDTPVEVKHAAGKFPPIPNDPALSALAKGVDVFVIVAGVPRKPGMTRDDLFKVNAGICLDIVTTCAKVAPQACYCIVTNPVNSTVPIAAQALRKLGVYDKNKLFGVSTLDVLRATTFVNGARAPHRVESVPVIGGHSDVTIVPLFSQLPGDALKGAQLDAISKRTQQGGTEVVKAKAGKGSATLSMAEAGARFAMAVVDGLTGRGAPVMYSYVDTDGQHELPFLAIPVVLGRAGIAKRLPIGPMTSYEKKLLAEASKGIAQNIKTGEAFARSKL